MIGPSLRIKSVQDRCRFLGVDFFRDLNLGVDFSIFSDGLLSFFSGSRCRNLGAVFSTPLNLGDDFTKSTPTSVTILF